MAKMFKDAPCIANSYMAAPQLTTSIDREVFQKTDEEKWQLIGLKKDWRTRNKARFDRKEYIVHEKYTF